MHRIGFPFRGDRFFFLLIYTARRVYDPGGMGKEEGEGGEKGGGKREVTGGKASGTVKSKICGQRAGIL